MEDISLPLAGEMCGSFDVTFSKRKIYQNGERAYPFCHSFFFFFFITDKIFNYFYIFHSSPQVSGVNAEEATPPQC